MADPNEPRLMKPRRQEKLVHDNATGDAGRDGFTRVARREFSRTDDPFSNSGGISPEVGERDYRRGPRFSEDY